MLMFCTQWVQRMVAHAVAAKRNGAMVVALASGVALSACGGGGGSNNDAAAAPQQAELATLPIQVRATPASDYITKGTAEIARGELIVTVQPTVAHDAMVAKFNAAGLMVVGRIPEAWIYQVLGTATTSDALATAKANVLSWPEVKHAVENYKASLFAVETLIPDDPGYRDSAWALNSMGVGEAWKKVSLSDRIRTTVKVGVIDSGFQGDSNDLAFETLYAADGTQATSSLPPAAVTAVDATNPAEFVVQTDRYHHGMHVAGIIAAKSNNKVGTAGIAWQAPIELHGAQLASTMSNLANFARMIRSGVKVVNLSFGATERADARIVAPMWGQLIQTLAAQHQFLAVFAAGNRPVSAFDIGLVGPLFDPTLPQHAEFAVARSRILVVGALEGDSQYASYSAGGLGVEIVAAGGGDGCFANNFGSTVGTRMVYQQNADALSDPNKNCRGSSHRSIRSLRYGGGTMLISGTSQAAPFVTGATALLWSLYPTLSASRLKEVLVTAGNADPVFDRLSTRHPKLRLDRALDAASAATLLDWNPQAWQPAAPPTTALIIANISCAFNGQTKEMANLPVEIYPDTNTSVNLVGASAATNADGYYFAEIPLSVVSTYQTDLFYLYVAPMEGRNPVINKPFRMPSAWSGPAVRTIDVKINARSEQGCAGNADTDSIDTVVFGLADPDNTQTAPTITGLTFVPTQPARLEVSFSQPMHPTIFTTGSYVPISNVWETTSKFVITFSSYTPGGYITLIGGATSNQFGFRSASGVYMATDVTFQFPLN